MGKRQSFPCRVHNAISSNAFFGGCFCNFSRSCFSNSSHVFSSTFGLFDISSVRLVKIPNGSPPKMSTLSTGLKNPQSNHGEMHYKKAKLITAYACCGGSRREYCLESPRRCDPKRLSCSLICSIMARMGCCDMSKAASFRPWLEGIVPGAALDLVRSIFIPASKWLKREAKTYPKGLINQSINRLINSIRQTDRSNQSINRLINSIGQTDRSNQSINRSKQHYTLILLAIVFGHPLFSPHASRECQRVPILLDLDRFSRKTPPLHGPLRWSFPNPAYQKSHHK